MGGHCYGYRRHGRLGWATRVALRRNSDPVRDNAGFCAVKQQTGACHKVRIFDQVPWNSPPGTCGRMVRVVRRISVYRRCARLNTETSSSVNATTAGCFLAPQVLVHVLLRCTSARCYQNAASRLG